MQTALRGIAPFVPLFPKWGICRFHTVSHGRIAFSKPFGYGDEAMNTTKQVSPVCILQT
uniref:Uncharacterized protein n=1 Tax=Poecilia mexicana TaxID=48701 RepID=A0A3B3YDW8_9TELE